MGLPALNIERSSRSTRPALRVVPPRVGVRGNARRATDVARCRAAYNLACVLILGVALFGLGRVMLAAKATEAAIRSGELRTSIKAERLAGDRLEIDRSALTVPSRIESIAGASMEMAEADSVAYMALPAAATQAIVETPAPDQRVSDVSVTNATTMAGMLASVMEMAAGEAQVLLVGDVGLASTE